MTHKPTKQQQAILDAVAAGESIAIKARAGSAKSTTLEMIAKAVPGKSILYSTFNKHNVLEFKDKKIPNVTTATAHSLGMSLLTSVWGGNGLKVRDDKSLSIIKTFGLKGRKMNIQKAWDLFRLYGGADERDWEGLDGYLPDDLNEAVRALSQPGVTTRMLDMNKALFDEEGVIDYVDMLFLPVYLDIPVDLGVDIFLGDESQDFSVATLRLLEHMVDSSMQVIIALDPMQNIYRSMGAGFNNLEDLMSAYGLRVMPLNTCFRCKEDIVELAQTYVPDIEAHSEGGEIYEVEYLPDDLEPGAMVLGATNGQIIKEFIPRRMAGAKIVIRGHNFFETVYKKILREHASVLNKTNAEPSFEAIVSYCITSWSDTMEELPMTKGNEDKYRFLNNCVMVAEAAVGHFSSLREMNHFISDMSNVVNPDNVFSTIHRSKGSEAESVYILGYDKLTVEAIDSVDARMLAYVAITRAKSVLYLVDTLGEEE